MADYYGANATKSLTPTSGNILDPGVLGGKVRCMIDTYEAAAVGAGSTIQMGQSLPVGARIVGISLFFDALGSATISVGDAASAARYIAATSVASAGAVDMAEGDKVDGMAYEITGTNDTEILLTTASAAITGTVKLIVFYVVE